MSETLHIVCLDRDETSTQAQCGCQLYNAGHDGKDHTFRYCPLHTAAPRLLAALKGLYARYGRDYPADDEDWDAAEAAIKEAGGEA